MAQPKYGDSSYIDIYLFTYLHNLLLLIQPRTLAWHYLKPADISYSYLALADMFIISKKWFPNVAAHQNLQKFQKKCLLCPTSRDLVLIDPGYGLGLGTFQRVLGGSKVQPILAITVQSLLIKVWAMPRASFECWLEMQTLGPTQTRLYSLTREPGDSYVH